MIGEQKLTDQQIQKIFGVHSGGDSESKPEWYLESSQLSFEDQKWVCDNIIETGPILSEEECPSVRCNSDTYYHQVNTELTPSKQRKKEALLGLKKCTYRTPPKKIAAFLGQLFKDYPSKEGHWLYVAQNWPPRAINNVLAYMTKEHQRGSITIQSSAAFFTFLIKRRKRRRKPTGTNGTYKPQKERGQKWL